MQYICPETLREVNAMVSSLENLQDIPENGNKAIVFKDNISWIKEEEFPRLCRKYIDAEGQQIWKDIEKLEPEGKIKSICLYIRRKFKVTKCETEQKDSSIGDLLELVLTLKDGTNSERTFAFLCLLYFNICITEELYGDDRINMEWDKSFYLSIRKYYGNYFFAGRENITIAIENEKIDLGGYELLKLNNCLDCEIVNQNQRARNIECFKNVLSFYCVGDDQTINWEKRENSLIAKDECNVFFALSNVLSNILKGEDLRATFISSISKSNNKKDDNNDMQRAVQILPVNDMEFLLNLFEKLKYLISRKSITSVEGAVVNYFKEIDKCLKEYKKEAEFFPIDFCESYEKDSVIKLILNENADKGKRDTFFKMLEASIRAGRIDKKE